MGEESTSRAVEAARLLLSASPSPMLLFTPDLILLYSNAAHEQMTGKANADIAGAAMFAAFPSNDEAANSSAEQAIRAAVRQIMSTGEPCDIAEQRHDLLISAGTFEQRYWTMSHWPIFEGSTVVAILQRSADVTDNVRRRRLISSEKRAAEQSSGLSFFSFDPETDLFERGPGVDALFGFAAGDVGTQGEPFFGRMHPEDLASVREEIARATGAGVGASAAFDFRIMPSGPTAVRFVRARAGVERDPDDGRIKLFGTIVDMSDIQNSRAELEAMAKRNADLVIESNHRIKNSLAIASAMLAQQMRSHEDAAVQDALKTAATRIAAIADVHGELFKDTGVEWVDAGSLVEQFAKSFARTVDGDGGICDIHVSAEPIQLPSQHAVSLALTLNELLTNAVKYGTTSDARCEIDVTLRMVEGNAQLDVANNVASDRLGDIASQGVGTRLIAAFARQLDAEIDTRHQGDRFKARFTFSVASADLRHKAVDPQTGE